MAKDEVEYSKPSSLVDLEERQARGNESNRKVHTAEGGGAHSEDDGKARDFGESSTDEGFVGVAPEYANYANDTGKPLRAEEGPEQVLEDEVLGDAPAPSEPSSSSSSSSSPPGSKATAKSSK